MFFVRETSLTVEQIFFPMNLLNRIDQQALLGQQVRNALVQVHTRAKQLPLESVSITVGNVPSRNISRRQSVAWVLSSYDLHRRKTPPWSQRLRGSAETSHRGRWEGTVQKSSFTKPNKSVCEPERNKSGLKNEVKGESGLWFSLVSQYEFIF